MNDMIEKLKDNEAHRIFADMTKEEQEILSKLADKEQIEFLLSNMNWVVRKISSPLTLTSIYRIKPNYQPEPKFIDLEIVKDGAARWFGVYNFAEYKFLPFSFTHFHCLPSLPNFEGFYLNSGDKQTEVRPEWVARYMPNVIARFRS